FNQTLSAHLVVRDAKTTMDFYRKAFGAEEVHTSVDPSGKVMHATMRIAESAFHLNDEYPQMGAMAPASFGGTGVTLSLNFDSAEVDVDVRRVVATAVVDGRRLARRGVERGGLGLEHLGRDRDRRQRPSVGGQGPRRVELGRAADAVEVDRPAVLDLGEEDLR